MNLESSTLSEEFQMVPAYLLTMKLRKYGMILMTHGDNPSSDEIFSYKKWVDSSVGPRCTSWQ